MVIHPFIGLGFLKENKLNHQLYLFIFMNSCILYFSQTGNTKKFAETISDSIKIPAIYDITTTKPTIVNEYNTIILGIPSSWV